LSWNDLWITHLALQQQCWSDWYRRFFFHRYFLPLQNYYLLAATNGNRRTTGSACAFGEPAGSYSRLE
jgi:hypothetical protein